MRKIHMLRVYKGSHTHFSVSHFIPTIGPLPSSPHRRRRHRRRPAKPCARPPRRSSCRSSSSSPPFSPSMMSRSQSTRTVISSNPKLALRPLCSGEAYLSVYVGALLIRGVFFSRPKPYSCKLVPRSEAALRLVLQTKD